MSNLQDELKIIREAAEEVRGTLDRKPAFLMAGIVLDALDRIEDLIVVDETHYEKFVVLEGIEHGNRFYTRNDPGEPEEEKVLSKIGEVWYKILGYASTGDEALAIIAGELIKDRQE